MTTITQAKIDKAQSLRDTLDRQKGSLDSVLRRAIDKEIGGYHESNRALRILKREIEDQRKIAKESRIDDKLRLKFVIGIVVFSAIEAIFNNFETGVEWTILSALVLMYLLYETGRQIDSIKIELKINSLEQTQKILKHQLNSNYAFGRVKYAEEFWDLFESSIIGHFGRSSDKVLDENEEFLLGLNYENSLCQTVMSAFGVNPLTDPDGEHWSEYGD